MKTSILQELVEVVLLPPELGLLLLRHLVHGRHRDAILRPRGPEVNSIEVKTREHHPKPSKTLAKSCEIHENHNANQ